MFPDLQTLLVTLLFVVVVPIVIASHALLLAKYLLNASRHKSVIRCCFLEIISIMCISSLFAYM